MSVDTIKTLVVETVIGAFLNTKRNTHISNSPFQDYIHPHRHTLFNYHVTPRFKPFTTVGIVYKISLTY